MTGNWAKAVLEAPFKKLIEIVDFDDIEELSRVRRLRAEYYRCRYRGKTYTASGLGLLFEQLYKVVLLERSKEEKE